MAIITIQGEAERQQGIHYIVDNSLPPLGVGGMGQVFKGFRVDERTGVQQEAAIKFLFDDLPPNAIERSRREASIMIKNENIVEMFGFIEVDETDSMGNLVARHYHVASELLDGVGLDDLLRGKVTDAAGVPFAFAQDLYNRYMNDRTGFAIKVIKSVLSGIMALHDMGYIHRDIDPSNIMVTKSGKIKLIDFGIARQIDNLASQERRQLTTAGQFMGKAAYAAPELVVGDVANQNETTDIYAVGIMLFELIAGHLPFDGPVHEVLNMQLRMPLPLNEIQNQWLRDIIARATAKSQADRFASAAEFRVALEQLSRNSNPGRRGGAQQPMQQQPMQQQTMQQQPMQQQPMQQQPQPLHTTQPGEPPTMPQRQSMPPQSSVSGNNKMPIIIGGVAAAVLVVGGALFFLLGGDDNNGDNNGDNTIVQTTEQVVTAGTTSQESTPQPDVAKSGDVSAALSLLADAATAPQGLDQLKQITEGQDKSAASKALYELAQLYAQPDYYTNTKVLDNAKTLLAKDNKMAHELNEKAIALDPSNYKALYELGTDYYAGEARGAVDRDVDKARDLYSQGKTLAEQAADEVMIEKFSMRLRALDGE